MNHKPTLFQRILIFATFCSFYYTGEAQFLQTIDATNNGPYTPQSLISNVLLGNGVDVSNITYSGSPRAVGYFSGGTQSIGIERGILLTTGYAAKPTFGSGPTDEGIKFASNSNGSSAFDVNLDDIATQAIRDVAVYTITFTPTSDTLRFRYCFASEEYPEYSCTQFNDIFGFFIQGPGYPIPTNIAIVPGTNLPVAINNIHPFNNQNNPNPNPCFPFNTQYYNNNNNSSDQPVYDGYTSVLTAVAKVIPCESYTIKLAIADVFDTGFDSGVFIEAKSFGTSSLRVSLNTPGADGSIAEGCFPASITFSLANPLPTDYPININQFGSATAGIDFQNLPGNLTIPAGQTQLTVPIGAMEDNQAEPLEFVSFDVKTDACHRDTVSLFLRDNPILPPLMADTTICSTGSSILLDATVPVPTPQPPTFSNLQDVPIPDNYPSVSSPILVAGIQPTVLGPGSIRSVCLNIEHGYDDDLDLFLLSPGGQVLELSTDNGGSGDHYTNTCFTPTAITPINFPGPQAPNTATPFTGFFTPEGAWSDLWDTPNRPTNGTWRLQATDDFPSFSGKILDWSITFAPSYEVTYQWAPSADITCLDCPTAVVSPDFSTSYAVTATDTYGCTATDSVQVEIAALVVSTSIADPISCFGSADGLATVDVNVGGSNTYQWSDPGAQTTAQASNLAAGSYTVTVTNIGGCQATGSVTLTQPPLLELTTTAQNAVCFGQPSGNASVLVFGGTAPYQYLWSNGMTTATPSGLNSGTYTVTATDAQGCSNTQSINIIQPSAIQLGANQVQNVTCFHGDDGSISLLYSGATQPILFQWSSGQSQPEISGLTAGTYTVTLTDGNGCTNSYAQTITEPMELQVATSPTTVGCYGEATGALHLTINGGTPVYSASWQGPGGFSGTGLDLLQLVAGNYTATITDQKGCVKTLTTNLTQPDAVALNLPAVADTVCFSGFNGIASVVPAGGTPPYSFLWSVPGQATATATGLSSQAYQVTVTDAHGCTKMAQTTVAQKQAMAVLAQQTLPKCHNGSDGTAAVVSVSYGNTPASLTNFQFSWNTVPVQQNIAAVYLRAGQPYTVTASEPDGCTSSHTFTMGNPTAVVASITGSSPVKCPGEGSGWAAAGATGGTAPYTWLWGVSSTPNDSVGQGLYAGVNRVTVTDANGCPALTTVTIASPPPIEVQFQTESVHCFGDSSGGARASASGGTGPYQYKWSNGVQNIAIQDIFAGVYDVTVTDDAGCTTHRSAEVHQPAAPVSGTVDMREPRCFGDHNGRVIFHPAGGTPPYRYALDDQPYNGSIAQIGLNAGFYEPKIIDNNGCLLVLPTIEVTQTAKLDVDLGPDFRILLGRDTQLLALVSNNSGNYQLSWAPEDSTWLSCLDCLNPSVYNLQSNHYFDITATDSAGCRAKDQILISVERPRKVFVPTAFSPNGDLNNDLLLVHGQNTSKVLAFRIYDRWGEMVYEAKNFAFNDDQTGWDGNFKGQPLDPGVFVWVLEVEYIDGETDVYKGNTTLIR
jgi:gliding motility-associated-like protein